MNNLLDFIYNNQFLVIIFSFVIASAAQGLVHKNYEKYSKVAGAVNMTGAEVAQKIMMANGITDVRIESTNVLLGDHFDPKAKVVRLSPGVANSNSISSQAIAAHEIGHVLQYAQGSALIKFRNVLLPTVQISSRLVWGLIIGGILLQSFGLLYLGIAAFSVILLFQVATLPVEFDASSRALKQLQTLTIVDNNTYDGYKKVLGSAALTYVVAVITSVLTLLRFLSMARRR